MDPTPVAGSYPVDFGRAELVPSVGAANAWLLTVNGTAQSHVDLSDPRRIEFDYIRAMANVTDVAWPEGEPVSALHLGAGLCSLPRYIAVTRAGSTQVAIDADASLVELVQRQFGADGFDLRVSDAATSAADAPDASLQLVVIDCYVGHDVPETLTRVDFVELVRRKLRADGIAVANISDDRPFRSIRTQTQTWLDVFTHFAVIADDDVATLRRSGNFVLIGSDSELPLAELAVASRRDPGQVRVETGQDLLRR